MTGIFASRADRHEPSLAITRVGSAPGAISVIAVGVGLSAMVFALADPVLRPLPYARPDQFASISFGLPIPGSQADPADVPSLTTWRSADRPV